MAQCGKLVTEKTSGRRKGGAFRLVTKTNPTKTMRNEFPSESSMSPAWDHRALVNLRIELHSSPVEFLHLMAEEEHHPAFDPIEVRNLLRKERDMGHEPELLILGCMEMASFHHFISRGFGEESGARMRQDLFFLGILVVADPVPSRLEFVVDEKLPSSGPDGWNAA